MGCIRRVSETCRTAIASLLIASLAGATGCSREATPAAPAAPAPEAPAAAGPDEAVTVASDDTKGLVAPVALYPDPILEIVLQGAVQPSQIVLASRFLDTYAADKSSQPDPGWDTAVIGLLNYPRVLVMMSDSLDWTTDLGESVATDLEGVQFSVQELRWSAYNMGVLASNEWQDVVVTDGVIAILPAKAEQVSIPEYDGAALLDATEAAAPAAVAEGAPAPASASASAVAYAGAPAASVPVSYGQPQSSFWDEAAIFAGGAALGGLIGYWIGDDDDDDDWGGHHHHYGSYHGGHNKVVIEGDVNINRARPGTALRPGRPVVSRPGGRPGQPDLPRPVAVSGRPGKRPAAASQAGRPQVRPAGVAPARPSVRPATEKRDVKMPRPAAAPARASKRPQPAAKQARAPEKGAALAQRQSNPEVQRDRARGAASRTQAKQRPAAAPAKASAKQRAALKPGGGGSKSAKKESSRGKKSRSKG